MITLDELKVEVSKAQGDAKMMLAFYPSMVEARYLAVADGEPYEKLHLTLAYFGEVQDMTENQLVGVVRGMQWAACGQTPISGTINGLARFQGAEQDAVVALFDSPDIAKWREDLVKEVRWATEDYDPETDVWSVLEPSKDHGFIPHITLTYIEAGAPLPIDRIEPFGLQFWRVALVIDDQIVDSVLLSGVRKNWVDYQLAREFGVAVSEVAKSTNEQMTMIRKAFDPPQKDAQFDHDVTIEFPIYKMDDSEDGEEKRYILGVVLEPETEDLQGDIIDAEGIEKTAWNFLAKYNLESEIGLMHTMFGDIGLSLVESYISPVDFEIGEEKVQKGSWLLGMRVDDDETWEKVKSGELNGLSVAGMAKIAES